MSQRAALKFELVALRAIVALALVAASPAVAFAQATPASEAARTEALRLVREGAAAFDGGQYAAALDKFTAAFTRFPSPKIQFNIGQAARRLGKPVAAAIAFEAFLHGVPNPAPEDRAEAQGALKELAPKVARLEVKTQPPGADVSVDGVVAGKTPLAHPLILAPGTHTLALELPGHQPLRESVTLKGGDSPRLERTLSLSPAPAPPAHVAAPPPLLTAPPAVALGPPPAGPLALTAPATAPSRSGQRTLGKVLVWTGAGFATLGVGLLTASWVRYAGASDGKCAADMSCTNAKDDVDGFARWSKISFAAAGVSAVLGGALVLTARPNAVTIAGRF
jgi:PEGA domain